MTKKTPEDTSKSNTARNAAIGIGSAAVAAALLYAGKRFIKKPDSTANGPGQSDTPPSGETPETD